MLQKTLSSLQPNGESKRVATEEQDEHAITPELSKFEKVLNDLSSFNYDRIICKIVALRIDTPLLRKILELIQARVYFQPELVNEYAKVCEHLSKRSFEQISGGGAKMTFKRLFLDRWMMNLCEGAFSTGSPLNEFETRTQSLANIRLVSFFLPVSFANDVIYISQVHHRVAQAGLARHLDHSRHSFGDGQQAG